VTQRTLTRVEQDDVLETDEFIGIKSQLADSPNQFQQLITQHAETNTLENSYRHKMSRHLNDRYTDNISLTALTSIIDDNTVINAITATRSGDVETDCRNHTADKLNPREYSRPFILKILTNIASYSEVNRDHEQLMSVTMLQLSVQ